MLKLDTLTRKQQELLKTWKSDEEKYKYARIEGQAGTGKSYVALHILQEFMKDDLKKRECALFICRNAELAHLFASWLCNRLAHDKEDRDRVLERLYFMLEEEGEEENDTSIYQKMYYDEVQETLNCEEVECPANGFSLIVADEAHHIFGSDGAPDIFKLVKDWIFRNVNAYDDTFLSKVKNTLERNEDNARILLLSDASQAMCENVNYPDGYKVLSLNEVVRSCRKVLLTSQHYKRLNQDTIESIYDESVPYEGKSTWVDVFPWEENDNDTHELFQLYVKKILIAIRKFMSEFDGESVCFHVKIFLFVRMLVFR
jgi:hypothetical protein